MEIERAECRRCGFGWDVIDRPHRSGLCDSCRVRKSKKSPSNQPTPCKPWNGEFDLMDNPLKNGEPYLIGVRLCGHNDCVNKKHIEKSNQ